MAEHNYAESDRQMDENPTVEQCRRMGSTHRAYGWASNPRDYWATDEHRQAYTEGYHNG